MRTFLRQGFASIASAGNFMRQNGRGYGISDNNRRHAAWRSRRSPGSPRPSPIMNFRRDSSLSQPGHDHLPMLGIVIAGIIGKVGVEFLVGEFRFVEMLHYLEHLPIRVVKGCQG